MRIYLIGYMGCGKSTMGRKLSSALNVPFIDMDRFIEQKFFKTVPEIFATEGEPAFRQKERQALEELSTFENIIIATGGGAPCFFDNMELMNQTGHAVFLDVDYPELASRLLKSKTERPLIKGKSAEELVGFIAEMMLKRRPFYEKAKFILSGSEITTEDVIRATGLKKREGQ